MRELVMRLASNDVLVKAVFDHIRNLGLIAGTFIAANWRWGTAVIEDAPWPVIILNRWSGLLLYILATALYVLNLAHALHKLQVDAEWSGWRIHAFHWLYSLGAVSIVVAVFQAKH